MLRAVFAALILVACATAAEAQSSATGYFHEGAQAYVAGDRAAAGQAVRQGLQLDPDDPRLHALQQKLEQEQQQQNQSGQGESGEDEQDQQEGGSQGEDQEQQDGQQGQQPPEQNQDGEQEQQGEPEGQEPQDEQQGQGGQPQPEEGEASSEGQPAGAQEVTDPQRLSREQALRILQALEADEEQLLREVQRPEQRAVPRRVEKDW